MKTNWLNDNIKGVLSLVVVAFVFSYFLYCTLAAVKPDQQITIANITALGIVLNYWFGSSSGSAKKDETIAAQQTPPAVASTQSGDITVK